MRTPAPYFLALLVVVLGCGDSGPTESPLQPDATDVTDAASSITSADIRHRIGLLAHDSMRGRWTPSPELEEVATYVAAEFESFGLRAGAGSDYLQWYPAEGSEPGDQAMNTIGWLEGSDAALRSEYVVITAHMDHIGVGPPVDGDSIYNGADDNASGTAAVLELAEAFASLGERPRRSLVFITFSGEERGLWGSEYYSAQPTFPMARTVANLNIDMIGRNWPDTLVAVRTPDSSIGPTAERVAEDHPELGIRVIDDPWPKENLLFRSDQYHFFRFGVPVLFFTSGLHADYHRPSDEPDRIDYEKTERAVRLLFHIGLEIADANQRPS
jgi:Zn-dependent M28 family amino/carboxypeptidase